LNLPVAGGSDASRMVWLARYRAAILSIRTIVLIITARATG
jgi:hypothetical protein